MHAIILAGGKGARLAPYTDELPKSLVQITELSVLEIIAEQLVSLGFKRMTLCVSHFGEMIAARMGDGSRFGLRVDYCWDRQPLGTAAPLRLVKDWVTPALVMNSDILTAVDFGALTADHLSHGPYMTVVTHQHHVAVDFGVVESEDGLVKAVREKPSIALDVSAGIHVVDPRVRAYIPAGRPMDMPGLVSEVLDHGHVVRAARTAEAWHDIGTPQRLRAAVDAVRRDPACYRLRDSPFVPGREGYAVAFTAGASDSAPHEPPDRAV